MKQKKQLKSYWGMDRAEYYATQYLPGDLEWEDIQPDPTADEMGDGCEWETA